MDDEKPQNGIELLVAWARHQAGLAGNGHIDENERFKLKGIIEAIDAESEDFSKAPVSMAAARASRERNSALITPREALIEELRDIDAGVVTLDAILILERIPSTEGRWNSGWRFAGFQNTQEVIGFGVCGVDMLIGNMRNA